MPTGTRSQIVPPTDPNSFGYTPAPRPPELDQADRWFSKGGWRITRAHKRAYVILLAEVGTATEAARRLGRKDATGFTAARKVDAAFDQACRDALEAFADKLELEAFRRGYEGTSEPMVSMGKVVTHKTVYDNRLLETVLRAKKPVEYAIRQQVTHDISDRLADRLEAARLRMLDRITAPVIDAEAQDVVLQPPSSRLQPTDKT